MEKAAPTATQVGRPTAEAGGPHINSPTSLCSREWTQCQAHTPLSEKVAGSGMEMGEAAGGQQANPAPFLAKLVSDSKQHSAEIRTPARKPGRQGINSAILSSNQCEYGQ
mmetsp:Transcript_12663/g.35630  ORF Transcript_12663/g.35630 Transcript_12663/m.35630 type:complete len:110 (+) Transcript_12663:1253-1582(+)